MTTCLQIKSRDGFHQMDDHPKMSSLISIIAAQCTNLEHLCSTW